MGYGGQGIPIRRLQGHKYKDEEDPDRFQNWYLEDRQKASLDSSKIVTETALLTLTHRVYSHPPLPEM